MEAVAAAARGIKAGEIELAIAGGVEIMTRAPFVTGKAQAAFQRSTEVFDTTIGWRFVNPVMKKLYGVDSMPETAENVADEHADLARRPGRLRAAIATSGPPRAQAKDVRRGDRRRRDQGPQGQRDPHRKRRASARRYKARGAGEARRHRAARAAPSPPATPPASTMARPRCSSPRRGRPKRMDLRPSRASSATRPPASRRG